uniref:hypothetical protein n=1 Tax=Pseudomonas viridiflava TaxID=33069 RepID=UPI00197E5CB4
QQTMGVVGGLPAMNNDAIFLTYRVDCIAGKPPPTKNVFIQQITCCLIRGGFRKQNFLTRCRDATSTH